MAYGYARETYVVKNVFEHIGDSAMAAWGEVDELNGEGDGVWRGRGERPQADTLKVLN